MKKLAICFAILALLLVPSLVMASGDPAFPCTELGEVDTWRKVDDEWQFQGVASSTALARCWKTAEGHEVQGCNKGQWPIDFTNHASVAQWSYYSISNTRWDWLVRKPGVFAADCITLWIQSNGPIDIVFTNFGNLSRPEDEVDLDTHGTDTLHEIDTWYSLVTYTPAQGVPLPSIGDAESNGWTSADELSTIHVDDSKALHEGKYWKLFNMIEVKNCNSVGEYENNGVITITPTNIKPFINPVSGSWDYAYSPLN